MTTCVGWEELAGSFLTHPERVESHRADCEDCSRRWKQLQHLVAPISAELGQAASLPAGEADPCPDLAAWAALAERRVPDWARETLIDHLSECDRCSALWQYLVDVEYNQAARAREGHHEQASREARRSPYPSARGLLLAAASLVCLVFFLANPPTPISSGGSERWRGPTPALMAEAGWLQEPGHSQFEWQEWVGADGYRLRVWSSEGALLHERYMSAERLRLELNLSDVEGQASYWVLDALGDGAVVASTGVRALIPAPLERGRAPSR